MKIKLNYWQAALLCLPFISGMLLLEVPNTSFAGWITASAIANLLMVFGICITVCYQTHLVLSFNRSSPRTSIAFKVNALIPAVFFILYFFDVIYSLCTRPAMRANEYPNGPVKIASYNWHGWVIFALLIHSVITFLFINKQYVASTIKKIDQNEMRQQLTANFLNPIRVLIKTCLWVYFVAMILICLSDIFRYTTRV